MPSARSGAISARISPAERRVTGGVVGTGGQAVGLGNADIGFIDQVGPLALEDVLGGGGELVLIDQHVREDAQGDRRVLRRHLRADPAAEHFQQVRGGIDIVGLGQRPARRAFQPAGEGEDVPVVLIALGTRHRRGRQDHGSLGNLDARQIAGRAGRRRRLLRETRSGAES